MFLLGDMAGGDVLGSFEEFRDSHEKALVRFRLSGTGAAGSRGEMGAGAIVAGARVFVGESWGGGDQGMAGKTFDMLLNDNFLLVGSFSLGLILASAATATATATSSAGCQCLSPESSV